MRAVRRLLGPTYPLIFVALLSAGCAVRTVTPPDGMTSEEAKSIIEGYLTEKALDQWNTSEGVTAGDASFTRLVRYHEGGEPVELETVRYADLGEFQVSYRLPNVLSWGSFFVIGPTVIEITQDDRALGDPESTVRFAEEGGRVRAKSILWSLAPLWIAAPSLWVQSDEERFFQALTYMKARQQAARRPDENISLAAR